MTDRTTLQSLEAAAKAATPGPWTYEVLPDTSDTTGIRIYSQGLLWDSRLQPGAQYPTEVVGGSCCCCGSVGVSYEKDAAFIALANPSAILSLLSDLAAKDAENERLRNESAELTKALTGLTCGGSEFFVRRGERYVADVKACVEYVRESQRKCHERWANAERKARDAEARALTQGDRNAG
jgi:hypothetical protein